MLRIKYGDTPCFGWLSWYKMVGSSMVQVMSKKAKNISRSQDVPILLLSKEKLSEKYPWLNTEGVAMGSNGKWHFW